jgi:dihydroxy-acid dehydratase
VKIDIPSRTLSVELSAVELAGRLAQLPAPPAHAASGVMSKYARLVSSAAQGAITA